MLCLELDANMRTDRPHRPARPAGRIGQSLYQEYCSRGATAGQVTVLYGGEGPLCLCVHGGAADCREVTSL